VKRKLDCYGKSVRVREGFRANSFARHREDPEDTGTPMVVAVHHQSEVYYRKENRGFTSGSGMKMKWWKPILLACFAAGALAVQHGRFSTTNPTTDIAGTVAAQSSQVHILSPVPSQQLSTNFVDVNYELVNPGSSGGSPDFQVQLDGRDPVSTQDTTCTFTGLTPGQHTIIVQLVDANGTPVTNGRSTVVFFVGAGASQQQGTRAPGIAVNNNNDEPAELASASSALPLLSIIGFGVLLGGVATALRTRG